MEEQDNTVAQGQPISAPKRAAREAEEPAAVDPELAASTRFNLGQRILFARSVGAYPVHVVVKETDWSSAVGACAVYLAMSREHKAWAWMGVEDLRSLIATLQEAERYAAAPTSDSKHSEGGE